MLGAINPSHQQFGSYLRSNNACNFQESILSTIVCAPDPVSVHDPNEPTPISSPVHYSPKKRRVSSEDVLSLPILDPIPTRQEMKGNQTEDGLGEINNKYTVQEIVQKRRRMGFDEYLVRVEELPARLYWMRRENLKGDFELLLNTFEVLPEHNRIFDGLSCHQCKVRKNIIVLCKNFPQDCPGRYCLRCLEKHYESEEIDPSSIAEDWMCPYCRDLCSCSSCRKSKKKPCRQVEVCSQRGRRRQNYGLTLSNGNVENLYIIESVKEKRTVEGRTQYLVVWEDNPAVSESWENEEKVFAAPLIAEIDSSKPKRPKPKPKPKVVKEVREEPVEVEESISTRGSRKRKNVAAQKEKPKKAAKKSKVVEQQESIEESFSPISSSNEPDLPFLIFNQEDEPFFQVEQLDGNVSSFEDALQWDGFFENPDFYVDFN